MSKHAQCSFVSFPSSDTGSQVESKSRSRRLEIGSLLRSKKLGGADLSSKKRALDVDGDVGGKGEDGSDQSTTQPVRVKRTRLHSGVSIASISNPSKLQPSIAKPRRVEPNVDAPAEDQPYHRERTSSSSSVQTIRPVDVKECVDSRLRVSRTASKPCHVGLAAIAKAVLTPSDVNIPKHSKDDASANRYVIGNDEDVPGWLLSNHDGNARSAFKETNYAFKCLKSVQDFTAAPDKGQKDPNPIPISECIQPDVCVKLFRQHVELWDTKPSDVYIYRAQVHLTTPLSSFNPCMTPLVQQLEICCTSLFPSPSQEYITYYTGETTPGRRLQIDPSKGIHIGERWWRSIPKEGSGTGVEGQWGWYVKMWIPIPMYVMRGREMGVFKLSTKVWMGKEKGVVDGHHNPEPICAAKEFSVSCLRWTGKSFSKPKVLHPPSGFLVPTRLVSH